MESQPSLKISMVGVDDKLILVKLPIHVPLALFSTTNKLFLSIASTQSGAFKGLGKFILFIFEGLPFSAISILKSSPEFIFTVYIELSI